MAEPAHATTEQPAPQDTPDGPTGIHAEVTSETTSAPASEAASETVSVSESMSESVSESASTTETALTQEFVITNQTAESPTLKTPIVASVETAIVNEASIETAIVDEAPMEVVSTNEATLETPVVETTTGPAVEIASAAPAAELINSIDTTPIHEHQESVTQASETISESIHVATIEAPVVQSAESIVTVSSEEYSTEVPQAATEEAEELFVVAEAPEPAVLETFEPLVMTKAEPKTASVFQEIPPTKFTYETPNNGSVSDLSEKRVISQPVPNNLETGLPRWQPIHYPAATTSADAPDTNDDDQDIVFEFDQPESSTRATHHTRATRSTTV
jgi:epidermal growth factor receptor substrate 15